MVSKRVFDGQDGNIEIIVLKMFMNIFRTHFYMFSARFGSFAPAKPFDREQRLYPSCFGYVIFYQWLEIEGTMQNLLFFFLTWNDLQWGRWTMIDLETLQFENYWLSRTCQEWKTKICPYTVRMVYVSTGLDPWNLYATGNLYISSCSFKIVMAIGGII